MTVAKKHVSFDLDGTLVDSFPVMRSAWNAVCSEFGLVIPFENYRVNIGLPFKQIMLNLGLENAAEEIKGMYFDHTRANYSEIGVYEGQKELFYALKAHDLSISIITSKPRENAEHLLNTLAIESDLLVCGDDFTIGKPHPYPMFYANKTLGLDSTQTIYIGDMLSDFQFAVNANVDFIWFSGGEFTDISSCILNPRQEAKTLSAILGLLHV